MSTGERGGRNAGGFFSFWGDVTLLLVFRLLVTAGVPVLDVPPPLTLLLGPDRLEGVRLDVTPFMFATLARRGEAPRSETGEDRASG